MSDIKVRKPLLDKVISKSFSGVIRRQTKPVIDELRDKTEALHQAQQEVAHLKDDITATMNDVDKYKTVAKKRAKQVYALAVENTGLTESVRRNASLYSVTDSQYAMRMPMFYRYLSYGQIYLTADLSPEITSIINKLCQELDRRGNRWVPKWTCKCPKCKTEFQTKEPFDRCPICDPPHDEFYDKLLEMLGTDFTDDGLEQLMRNMGQTEDTITAMIVPDRRDYLKADKFFRDCNDSHQNIEQIDKQCAKDVHVSDAWFYIMRWMYNDVDADGVSHDRVPLELYRGDPALIRKVIDGYNKVGGIWYKCLVHGHLANGIVKKQRYQAGVPVEGWEWPRCDICNRPMHEVMYVQLQHEVSTMDKAQFTNYYIAGEVMDNHFYEPNTAHGFPPMITLFVKTATLLHQDNYMYDTFKDRRLPQCLVWSKTANPTSAIARWDKVLERLTIDPTYIPHICVEPEGSNSGEMGMLPLMPKLNEMEYIEGREEQRKVMADFFGVFYRDYARSSNNPGASEGPRMQVDPKTVESLEKFYNHNHNKLTDLFGVADWWYHKVPAEDRDVMRKLQIEQLEWQNSQIAQNVGFETTRDFNGDLKQRKSPLDAKDIGALKDITLGIIGLREKLKMEQETQAMAMSPDPDKTKEGTDRVKHEATYTPQDKTPDGSRRLPYDKLQKSEEDIEKAGVGESKPSTFSPSRMGASMQLGAGSAKKPTPSTFVPGSKGPYQSSDGSATDSKEALGGKERSRPGTQQTDSKSELQRLTAILMAMLMNIRRREHPTEKIGNGETQVGD